MYGNLRSNFFKKGKQNHHTPMNFLVEIIKIRRRNPCDKRVFVIIFFKVLENYGHGTNVNLQHLAPKNVYKSRYSHAYFAE